ncbi:MAG: methionine--tRNA ligase subunit beta [Planctomycetota bacterium]
MSDAATTEKKSNDEHAAEAESPFKPEIVFEDFARVDLRVAKILEAGDHPKADRLLKLTLDDGSGTPRQICAGIKGHYTPDELVGRLIVIVANLAPRQLRGEESRGMLLAASDADKGSEERVVALLSPLADMPPGSIVS